MNIKKIGLTALAASLVSTSASFAGELTATGAASITVENYSTVTRNAGVAYSMADSVTLAGSTELDNGLTVSMSFELDAGGDASPGSFDDHSVSISSDGLGTFKFSGNSGSSAVSAIDATAAGDVFDTFDTKVGGASASTAETATAAGDAAMLTSPGGGNTMLYTLPAFVDGLSVSASYTPQGSNAASSSAFGGTYTGVEGLSISYGVGSNDGSAGTANNADVTTMKATYAYGPVTLGYSDHEFDSATATRDQDVQSYSVAYTVTDGISVTYGTETFDSGETAIDAEYSKVSVAYTSGGMTVTAVSAEGENISYSTDTAEDVDYWGLTVAFAF
jgi:outer membrane protein OmpU